VLKEKEAVITLRQLDDAARRIHYIVSGQLAI